MGSYKYYDVIWPSNNFNLTGEECELLNEGLNTLRFKDRAWKFKGKAIKLLVPRAIKQWRFLKGYGMKDCKLLDFREYIHSTKLIT